MAAPSARARSTGDFAVVMLDVAGDGEWHAYALDELQFLCFETLHPEEASATRPKL